MSSRSKVVLVYCASYETQAVNKAVQKGLAFLGGAQYFAKAGEKILVKPNLLAGESPDHCISPHPAVFRAVLEAFQRCGAKVSFGDSPGFGNLKEASRSAGLLAVAEELNVPLADFQNGEKLPFPDGNLIKEFTIARGALQTDGLISLAKLKTHSLTRITGAIKNQFGCIPGTIKAVYHTRLPDADEFSKMLVDLNLYLKPRLYIMDGIIAMQGNGPRIGSPRNMNVLLFSTDPVALDATVCRMVHLDESLVGAIVYGNKFGLGSSRDVEILGDPIERFDAPNFVVNRQKIID